MNASTGDSLAEMLAFKGGDVETMQMRIYCDGIRVSGVKEMAMLEEIREKCICILAANGIDNFIWQGAHSGIQLVCVESPIPHLLANVPVQDSITDEWFLIFLLRHITASIKNVVAQVCDADGEFLLIEGALVLPPWVTPEEYDRTNRVFMRRGLVTLLRAPESTDEAATPLPLDLATALTVLERGSLTEHDSLFVEEIAVPGPLNDCISDRLAGFPREAIDYMHVTRARLPVSVAHVLRQSPQLVSAAVQAFYNKGPEELARIRTMQRFPPNRSVEIMVPLGRCLYAQLMQHAFHMPRPFEMAWPTDPSASPDEALTCDVGMRLACGFEILFHSCQSILKDCGDEDSMTAPSRDTVNRFILALKSRGFFDGLVEGSQAHRARRSLAETFASTSLAVGEAEDLSTTVARTLMRLLKMPHSASDFPVHELRQADSAEWLNVSSEELEARLSGTAAAYDAFDKATGEDPLEGGESDGEEDEGDEEEEHGATAKALPAKMASTMHSFLNEVSGLEGAEAATAPVSAHPVDSGAVSFDFDIFMAILNQAEISMPARPEDKEEVSAVGVESGAVSETMTAYMHEMDSELLETAMASTFKAAAAHATPVPAATSGESVLPGLADPLDVDANMVESLLESFALQDGAAGPASNVLRDLGINLESLGTRRKAGLATK